MTRDPWDCHSRSWESSRMENVELSVIVVLYNSKWDKIKVTLESIINQKGLNYEVIISDDGSDENYYPRIEKFFYEKNFSRYVLLNNTANVGTIKNCIRAINESKGKYVKGISPGDLLIGSNTLAEWLGALKESGRKWSFGDILYIRDSSEDMFMIGAHPPLLQDITPYKTNNEIGIKYNYVIREDRAAGVGILTEKQIWLSYLNKLALLIRYVEDLTYNMMVLENNIPFYFQRNVVAYDYGVGISTSGNREWLNIILQEKSVFDKYISSRKEYRELLSLRVVPHNLWCGELSRMRMSSLYVKETELTKEMYVECIEKKMSDIRERTEGRYVWIYGASGAGQMVEQFLRRKGIYAEGFLDMRYKEIKKIGELKVIGIESLKRENVFLIISILEYREDVLNYIRQYGYDEKDWIYIAAQRSIAKSEMFA